MVPLCFLLGECVALFSPHEEVAASLFSPLQGTLRNLSHLLLRDGAGVCVAHWCVQKQHFACSGVRLHNSEECVDFLHRVDYPLDTAYIAISCCVFMRNSSS